ncbi:MAG: hypothetical protein AAGF79_19335 [Pseudomonadota bacterium]
MADDRATVARTVLRDFGNFALVVIYYPIIYLVIAPAWGLDRIFGTALCDRVIGFCEWLDG